MTLFTLARLIIYGAMFSHVGSVAAAAANRRGFMGLLVGARALLTGSARPTAVAPLSAALPNAIPLETAIATRARQLAVEYAGYAVFPGAKANAGQPEWRRIEDERTGFEDSKFLGIADVDMLRDWAATRPEAKNLEDELDELVTLLELDDFYPAASAESSLQKINTRILQQRADKRGSDMMVVRQELERRRGRIAELQAQLAPFIRQEPWASWSWMKIFGIRLARAELTVQTRTGLTHFQVQELLNFMLSPLGCGSVDAFWSRYMKGHDAATSYSAMSIAAVIGAIREFAPSLASRLTQLHLRPGDSPTLQDRISETVSRLGQHQRTPRERTLTPEIFHSVPISYQMIDVYLNRDLDYATQTDFLFDRVAGMLMNIIEQTRHFIENLEHLPPAPIREILLEKFRDQLEAVEFELATLGLRIKAMFFYKALKDAYPSGSANDEVLRLAELVPEPDSRAWLNWELPEISFDAHQVPRVAIDHFLVNLRRLQAIQLLTFPRLERLLGERLQISDVIRVLATAPGTREIDKPNVIEQQYSIDVPIIERGDISDAIRALATLAESEGPAPPDTARVTGGKVCEVELGTAVAQTGSAPR